MVERRRSAGGHENSGKTRGPVHKFFTPERRFLRMAAELGMVAFKLERLALDVRARVMGRQSPYILNLMQ